MHSMCMCNINDDCLGNICLLFVLSRPVTPRATGHALRPRLNLSKHTHTHTSHRGDLAWLPLLLPLLPCVAHGQLQANSDAIEAAVPWQAPAGPRVGIQNGIRSRNPTVWNTTVSAPPIAPVRTDIPGTRRAARNFGPVGNLTLTVSEFKTMR